MPGAVHDVGDIDSPKERFGRYEGADSAGLADAAGTWTPGGIPAATAGRFTPTERVKFAAK